MNRRNRRNFLVLPKNMLGIKPQPISIGECRFCNRETDVFSTDRGVVLLHSSTGCDQFIRHFTQPGSTECADQNNGGYWLE